MNNKYNITYCCLIDTRNVDLNDTHERWNIDGTVLALNACIFYTTSLS